MSELVDVSEFGEERKSADMKLAKICRGEVVSSVFCGEIVESEVI